jgi:signal transduction histidine kinase
MWAPQRFTHRLLLFTFGSIVTVLVALTFNSLRIEQDLLERGMMENLKHIAATAAQAIPATEHSKIQGPDDLAFFRIRSFLRNVKKANDLKTEIYTLIRDPDKPGLTRFAVMTNKKPFFGAPYPETEGLKRAFETGKPQTSAPYKDEHGTWVSAYAPIVSKDGRVQAVVEVDQREAQLAAIIRKEGWKAFLFALAILGIAFPFVLRFGDSLTKPIHDLSRRMRRIQNGKPIQALPDSGVLEIQELQQALATLANVVKDREFLVQEKLQTLQETDHLRRDLITMVSHELKTPLTGIVAAAEFLATIELSEEERLEFTQDLLLQSHSFSTILDRLIQFSALQAKPLPHHIQDLSLKKEIHECFGLLKHEISSNHFQIQTLGLENLWIRGEETRVRRALIEILKNALEHSAKAKVIQIEAHQIDGRIELRIRDKGTGISPETQKLAFAPLTQDGKLLVGKKAGLGMGLPLAKLSLEGIEAILEIETTGPEGTTILIRFLSGTPLLLAPSIRGETEKNRIL